MHVAFLSLAALLLSATTPPEGTLAIDVGQVRNGNGTVHVDICPQDRFLKDDCPFSGTVHASAGTTFVTVKGLPPGRYAVQAFHDENGNGSVDQGLFGIPREGVGFSNDAAIRFGPPKFDEAAFDFSQTRHIKLKMRYFLDSKVPRGPR